MNAATEAIVNDAVCIILAGGRGHRMASARHHKTCFPVGGRPAIVRALDTYKAVGLRRFVVVVGNRASQVISTVAAEHPEVTYVYQTEARGTGHAAALAVQALAIQSFAGPTMITAGDKFVRPVVVRELLNQFAKTKADAVVATLPPSDPANQGGRIVTNSRGRLVGIVENNDLETALRHRQSLRVGGRRFTPCQLKRGAVAINSSMYVFRFNVLHEAVKYFDARNTQGELYLTEAITWLAARGRVETIRIRDPEDLMGFNTPAELLAIEQSVRRRERIRVSGPRRRRASPKVLKPAREWLAIAEANPPEWSRIMRRTYGPDEHVRHERSVAMKRLVNQFASRFGPDRPMVLCRAPARINLMGRHVDHRGGFMNVMAVNRETLLAAAKRDDDVVSMHNGHPRRYPAREFQITEALRESSWTEWMDFVGSKIVRQVIQAAPDDWSHFARAPMLRLQHESPGMLLRGMDCVLDGNVPMGAGLGSSSTLVAAFAEAAVTLNGLDISINDLVNLCGEGEWFIGSRHGAADHAAIRVTHAGRVSRIGFHPFRVCGEAPFPSQLRVVIAHSGSPVAKGSIARDKYNQRVACLEVGQLLLRRRWPAASGIEYLRDLAPKHLKVQPAELYRALKLLPDSPRRSDLRRNVPRQDRERLEEILATHRDPRTYDLRGAMLYGISECLRSESYAELLARRDLSSVGRTMCLSHDGDRLFRFGVSGKRRRFRTATGDTALEELARQNVDPIHQHGRYACSTAEIDQLVDLADGTEGVVGAQLVGAGVGGCMMILAHTELLSHLLGVLRQRFYRPRGLPMDAHVCVPVTGAGLVSVKSG